ncbi:hypothetical protein ACQCX5_05740 [Propionibacteriaceae bacterium G57]|uniref:hypothetical protein n=1 Tax=Aestuariimicrobium sp. G57 TaxID=3418485 RepID=UPI003DA6DD4B
MTSSKTPFRLTPTRLTTARTSTVLLACLAAVALNLVFGIGIGYLALPFLFLDTIGTFVASALFGTWWGIAVGVITNLVLGWTIEPAAFWFIPVQVLVAVIVGLSSRRDGYTVKTAPIAAALCAVLVPLLSTAIAVMAFGGSHGGVMDGMVAGLQRAGQSLFSAAFWPRVGLEFIDKAVTALIALGLVTLVARWFTKQGGEVAVDEPEAVQQTH